MSQSAATTSKDDDKLSKELEVLLNQQEADSDDEGYISEGADVMDANDLSTINNRESLDLNLNEMKENIWLIRLPKFLSEKFKDRSFMNGQPLGKVRVEKLEKPLKRKPLMRLQLTHEDSEFADIPHEYEVRLTKDLVPNQYAFTEENLANFNDDNNERTELDFTKAQDLTDVNSVNTSKTGGDAPIPPSIEPPSNPNEITSFTLHANQQQQPLLKKKRRFNKFKNRDGTQKVIPFVKTIPKKTTLIGKIVHECTAVPAFDDPNYAKIVEARRKLMKEDPRPKVTLLQENTGVTFSNTGLTLKTDNSTFLKTATVKNKSEGRAIRMPQKDLFDILFKLFDEYDYWSLKGIKERTKQPEVYLKETLDQIAVLIKKGPYALRYALKKEYKELKDQERAAKLGELGLNEENKEDQDDEDEDENEEDLEMEDIV